VLLLLRRERECLRGTSLFLQDLCQFLSWRGWAEVQERPDGPWVVRVQH
jgi:hypothetical protein